MCGFGVKVFIFHHGGGQKSKIGIVGVCVCGGGLNMRNL